MCILVRNFFFETKNIDGCSKNLITFKISKPRLKFDQNSEEVVRLFDVENGQINMTKKNSRVYFIDYF
jgi:hypothetical protein